MDKQKLAREILAKYGKTGYVSPEKQPVNLTDRFAELDAIASGNDLTKGNQSNEKSLVRKIVEEPIKQLIVKPVARATEAITRTVAPESLAAKGYEEMADNGEGQTIGGIDIPAQKAFGEGGGKQVIGEGLQSATYLFPYGKVAGLAGKAVGKVAGNIAAGALGGYTADVGYGLTNENETTGEALTPGLGTAIGAAIPAVGPALRATGRVIGKTGSTLAESVIPISSREAQILQAYKANKPFMARVADVLKGTEKAPQIAGKTALEKGLIGTKSGIGVQAQRASDSLWKDVISPRLKQSDQAVDLDGFFLKIQKDIIAKNPELSRQKSLLEALKAIKQDYAGTKVVSLEGLQKLKEGWAKFVPEKAYKGKPIGGAFNEVRNEMAGEARQTIYKTLGDDVRQAYLDYGNLQGLKELGQVAMTGAKLKGGSGSFVSEVFNRAVTPIATIGGQAVYRLGKGIEFIGSLGAKNLGQALGVKAVKLKFPGDAAVDDITQSFDDISKSVKATPNKQGGFAALPKGVKKLANTTDDIIAGNIDDLIETANKPINGKVNFDLLDKLDDIQSKVVKGKLNNDQRLSFNEIAKQLKREDLIPSFTNQEKNLPIKTNANQIKNSVSNSSISKSITQMKVKDLISYEGAPDKVTVASYVKKIKAGEPIEPIKVIKNADGWGIEDGKHRYQAYKQLGYKEIPVEKLN